MKVVWALLCETTIVDRDTNNVSLINVVDEITVPAPPPQGPLGSVIERIEILDLHLAILWARSNPDVPERGEARITVVAPDGSISVSPEVAVDLSQSQRMRAVGHLLDSPFPNWQEGQYLFKIESKTADLDWQEMFELPLWVKVQTDDFPYASSPLTSIIDESSAMN